MTASTTHEIDTMASVHEARTWLRTGDVTPADLVGACSRVSARLDSDLRAWAHRDEERALARTRFGSEDRDGRDGPLAGIPVGVKDNVCTTDMPTRVGSRLFEGFSPRDDAAAVKRLLHAGAIVLGKTACTELATNDPAPTRNPWDAACTPGGSSSGSAVAVATGMCFATVDTQTAADIVRPASFNGIVGFKPTSGRISRQGVVPVAWTVDTVGVQARTVADAALVASALTDRAALSRPARTSWPPSIGVLRHDAFNEVADEEVQASIEDVLDRLARAGAQVETVEPPEDLAVIHAAHRTVTFSECASAHEELYHAHADEMGEKLRTLLELGRVTPASAYLKAQRVRRPAIERLGRALAAVDALLVPTSPTPPPADLTGTGNAVFGIPWTFCGFPVIAIPSGLSAQGLPLGVQLVAPLCADEHLIGVARWCEEVFDVRLRPPPALRA